MLISDQLRKFSALITAGPLNYPVKYGLDPNVWDTSVSPPTLQSEIKTAINLERSKLLEHIDPSKLDSIIIVGSITTPNWDNESDIDTHFIVDISDDEVKKLYPTLTPFYNFGGHNLQFYLITPDILKGSLARYDNVYDVERGSWVKYSPQAYVTDPGPLEAKVYSKAEEIAAKVDLLIGKELRHKRDIEFLQDELTKADSGHLEEIITRLATKREELCSELQEIIRDLDKAHDDRESAFLQVLQDGQPRQESYNLVAGNLVWKLLERWGYVRLLHKLKATITS